MKNIQSFEEFLNENFLMPKLSKVDNEILQLALKCLPRDIVNNIKRSRRKW